MKKNEMIKKGDKVKGSKEDKEINIRERNIREVR